ncbi:hypothetical protein [Flavihumibacter fluvii]|uniref:hypothetical protein n=1 Tax=Flavihumibacter fluvii TaxID=2838157 RepID=UPI001BDDE8A0|nr:hypothetical protein [Flavihumibacter fluvii]ULQ53722.1 hypothetical protein KJS93_05220 [Flavihumibacter fluvii]
MKSNTLFSYLCAIPALFVFSSCGTSSAENANINVDTTILNNSSNAANHDTGIASPVPFDSASYLEKIEHITNGDSTGRWPVKTSYPAKGAILPYKRIIAYYGNLYSTRMGILGELPPAQMLEKLQGESRKWEAADPSMPVQPALHYIAVTAQGSPGKGGKYRLRMPFHQIDSILNMAKKIDAIVFLDIQVALSTLQEEIPQLEKYLAMPNVHLGIDPEFSMKGGDVPGKRIGTFDATDINYATDYLAALVKKHNLPAKILVVHRFTKAMVTNYQQIKTGPEVQLVMHMDGWGAPARKINTYRQFIAKEPVEFTGFKLFYKNDLKETPARLMTPEELLKLKPMPVYIQYQ